MKKILLILLTFTFLAACSSEEASNKNSSDETAKNTENSEGKKDEGKVEVEKGLLNVEVTLPASMFEGKNIDDIKASAKENGIKKVTQNEDGSITYKMSKSVHREMMKEIATSLKETVEETKTSGDYASIKDITYNDSFSEFTMIVDKEAYENSMDGFAAMTLGMSGMFYQLYDGADPDEYSVTIHIEDKATGEKFGEVVYPDALEETKEG